MSAYHVVKNIYTAKVKFSLEATRDITPKRVASGESHIYCIWKLSAPQCGRDETQNLEHFNHMQ